MNIHLASASTGFVELWENNSLFRLGVICAAIMAGVALVRLWKWFVEYKWIVFVLVGLLVVAWFYTRPPT